jgi:hypothetical protein
MQKGRQFQLGAPSRLSAPEAQSVPIVCRLRGQAPCGRTGWLPTSASIADLEALGRTLPWTGRALTHRTPWPIHPAAPNSSPAIQKAGLCCFWPGWGRWRRTTAWRNRVTLGDKDTSPPRGARAFTCRAQQDCFVGLNYQKGGNQAG